MANAPAATARALEISLGQRVCGRLRYAQANCRRVDNERVQVKVEHMIANAARHHSPKNAPFRVVVFVH
jgi:hypothetical protein